jgi:transposase
VVLDNLAAHRVDGVRQALAAAGASILYLPPYNPDYNPIEQLFAKLKVLLRKAAARTRDELWSTTAVSSGRSPGSSSHDRRSGNGDSQAKGGRSASAYIPKRLAGGGTGWGILVA